MTHLIIESKKLGLTFDDARLLEFCRANRDVRVERDKEGNILIMPPTGLNTSRHNIELATDFVIWNRQNKFGYVFDSNGGFSLPNGAMRAPDVAWVTKEKWEALSEKEQDGFAPICPDFVMELVSKSDKIKNVKAKMLEWVECGCRLGWLVDPKAKEVWVYEAGKEARTVPFSEALDGGGVLNGFSLKMEDVFVD